MKNKNLYLVVLVSVILLASLACGSSNEGTVITPEVQDVDPTQEAEPSEITATEEIVPENTEQIDTSDTEGESPTEAAPQDSPSQTVETFEVGELVEVDDQTIRLNSVEYMGDILKANFTLENKDSSDLNVSSMLSFSAKKSDGTLLEQEIFDCGTSSLDGSILPGDKLRGDICWSGADSDAGIRIYYKASLFGQGAIVWNAAEGVAEELEVNSNETSQVEKFQVGDLVQVQDHTMRLNSVEYQGSTLVADFSIENLGSSDIDVSSMLSFSAKKNDGTLLEQEYFDCGDSGLDGKVLPGDRLRGSVCWQGAIAEDAIAIYYEADLFGEGAIVWDASEGTAEPLELSDTQLKVDVFKVGDIVQLQEHTIVLNSVESGTMLKANFTVENQGSSDLQISSMLSFYARKRDGSSLEQEFFDCGTSFDGSVIPGDKLTGDICWSGVNGEEGIKIYYEAELFGNGAVVWVVD